MPVKSRDGAYPMRLTLPDQQVNLVFRDANEISTFLTSERDHWQRQNRPNGISFGAPETVSYLDPLTTAVFNEALNKIPNHLEALTVLDTKGAIISTGIYGRSLETIRDEKPKLYAGAVAAIAVKLAPQNRWPDYVQYPASIAQWLSGLGGTLEFLAHAGSAKAEKLTLDSAIVTAQEHRAETEEIKLDFAKWQEATRKQVEADIDSFRQSCADSFASVRVELAKSLSDSKDRIAELEDKVRRRLILEAPTTYWSNKASSHTKIAGLFGAVFLASLGFGIYWLTHWGVDLVANAHDRIVGDIKDPGLLALVPLAFITLPTLAFAWMLRHVSRVIVQNMALGADARLRGTIATTYSALTEEQNATPAELAIVLNALFRPVDGSTHTEIAPPNLAELLQMAKK